MTVARGYDFVQQLQPLRRQLHVQGVTPVRLPPGRFRLATRPTSTGSAAISKTIGMVVVAAFAASAAGRPVCDNHGHLTTNEIGRQRRQSIVLTVRPAVLDRHILSVDKSSLFQAASERGDDGIVTSSRRVPEEPDHRHRRLLRSRRERPSEARTTERGYKLASVDADSHLPQPQQAHARYERGKNIMDR